MAVVGDAVAAVEGARTAQQAIDALASALTRRMSVERVSLRMLMPGANRLRIVAVWSEHPTVMRAGETISVLATSYDELIATGRPVIRPKAGSASLLDDVLREEGIRSWVSIPLRSAGGIVGILSVSSRDATAFQPADERLFAELGAGVEGTLVELGQEIAAEQDPQST